MKVEQRGTKSRDNRQGITCNNGSVQRMEKINLGRRRACDGIHGRPKPTVLFNQKSLEPIESSMGTGVHKQ